MIICMAVASCECVLNSHQFCVVRFGLYVDSKFDIGMNPRHCDVLILYDTRYYRSVLKVNLLLPSRPTVPFFGSGQHPCLIRSFVRRSIVQPRAHLENMEIACFSITTEDDVNCQIYCILGTTTTQYVSFATGYWLMNHHYLIPLHQLIIVRCDVL
jgi:hypothetical protein